MSESSQVSAAKSLFRDRQKLMILIYDTSQFQKFALSRRMLATASETLHRLRQEDNSNSNESQRAVVPTGAQDSEGDSDDSDPHSEVWEDAEVMEVDEGQLADLDQRQPEVRDPPLPSLTT
jgi:hypothetical protein